MQTEIIRQTKNTFYDKQRLITLIVLGVVLVFSTIFLRHYFFPREPMNIFPPVVTVEYLGDGAEAMLSGTGSKYFRSPVTIAVKVNATSINNKMDIPESNISMFLNDVRFFGQTDISTSGHYTLHVQAVETDGSIGHYYDVFDVRDRFIYVSDAEIESYYVTSLNSTTDVLEVTMLFTSSEFNPCTINLASIALWLFDSDLKQIGNLLHMSKGYWTDGEYDPMLVKFESCVWRLSLQGEVPAGSCSKTDNTFSVTGSGLPGQSESFDFITKEKLFNVKENSLQNLITTVNPSCDCE